MWWLLREPFYGVAGYWSLHCWIYSWGAGATSSSVPGLQNCLNSRKRYCLRLWLNPVGFTLAWRREAGGRIAGFFKSKQLFGGQVTLFEVNSTRLIFGESKVVVAFNVWQPLKVLFKIWTPVIHWNNNCSVMCSNKLCLVDPSTRGFHHVSKFVNWRDEVLLVQFLYDAKTSIRGKLRVASNQKRISNWKMELKNCPPS